MENFRDIALRISNWGRWGATDQRGTLNLIGAEQIAYAASLARSGKIFSLGIPFDSNGPQDGKIRQNPVRHMSETGHGSSKYPGAFRYADDYVFMALQAASQWDSLAHVHYDGKLYNGFDASEVSVRGAAVLDITNFNPGVAGRGVLLDVAKHRGVDYLPRGTPISPDDLNEVAAAQGTEFRSGDILLIRTGWRRKFLETGSPAEFKDGEPGLSVACAEWCHDRDIAAVAADNYAVEVVPGEYQDEYLPFHMLAIRDMGMPLAEILDFELLAEDCAGDGIYEFLFVAPPILFTGGVGSPINPLALK
ncbi:MAG: cyclase family protein [Pontimonas sp.]|jgi:kynurenine formamidase|tara:strand:- start:6248 stop:7165 length:918 start_codon:yes stop_codon:yes gene_type:complete